MQTLKASTLMLPCLQSALSFCVFFTNILNLIENLRPPKSLMNPNYNPIPPKSLINPTKKGAIARMSPLNDLANINPSQIHNPPGTAKRSGGRSHVVAFVVQLGQYQPFTHADTNPKQTLNNPK